MTPKISVNRKWSVSSVMGVCITNSLYTRGSKEEYNKILTYVQGHEPTYKNIYVVAKDICEHSMYQTITNIMFLLEQQAVTSTFEIDGNDTI